MNRKKVWRYYCDFCKKSGCSASAMSKHEKHCTMNPNRKCRMCENMLENQQPMMIDMLAVLPELKEPTDMEAQLYKDLANKALIELRKLTDCPICIMSALRQKPIIIPLVTDFKYKDELDNIWSAINNEDREETEQSCLY